MRSGAQVWETRGNDRMRMWRHAYHGLISFFFAYGEKTKWGKETRGEILFAAILVRVYVGRIITGTSALESVATGMFLWEVGEHTSVISLQF